MHPIFVVVAKLPFPLTIRFKGMMQRGIETYDMDVTWVSSLSWYFLNLFGLRSVFGILLGEGNGLTNPPTPLPCPPHHFTFANLVCLFVAAADSVRDMQQMQGMGPAPMGQAPNMKEIFNTEKENLDLAVHKWDLEGIEEKILATRSTKGSPQKVKTT